jgi:hypothetical protein
MHKKEMQWLFALGFDYEFFTAHQSIWWLKLPMARKDISFKFL